MAYVVGPAAGHRRRIRENLSHAMPELASGEVRALCRDVPRNVGRMLAEISSGKAFVARVKDLPLTGPGVAALTQARDDGRPIIIVTGHFGNFDAGRAALVAKGFTVGGLYRPVDDPYLNRAFVRILSDIAEPLFPRGRAGLGQMIRFLRRGNALAILPDQHVNRGVPLRFFGRTALTSLAAAEMAVKYRALFVPIYVIRRQSSFEIVVEAPIEHGDPGEMMQAFNDSLEARIRADPAQWLWIHRRWKPERQRARAAPSMRR